MFMHKLTRYPVTLCLLCSAPSPQPLHYPVLMCSASIYLSTPGAAVRARSWTPLESGYEGFVITHDEAVSIADFLTVPRPLDDGLHPL